jgi:hypothetical protein
MYLISSINPYDLRTFNLAALGSVSNIAVDNRVTSTSHNAISEFEPDFQRSKE